MGPPSGLGPRGEWARDAAVKGRRGENSAGLCPYETGFTEKGRGVFRTRIPTSDWNAVLGLGPRVDPLP